MTNRSRAVLEPNLYGGIAYFYQEPNPALSEILLSTDVEMLVASYTERVATNYIARVSGRSDPSDPTSLAGAVRASVFIGGYKNDRHVGEITVGVEYAMADEFGRHSPADGQNNSTYEGSGDLRAALYAELPARI
ncbi:hypothetical protein SSEA_SKINNY_22 [Mycobacterium phage Skinny]|uniref:Uncharacterized protein n=6 Tax=Bongovirus bongo TaxID=1983750 RepID=A0A0M4RA65_9CAUD|nr:neck protein [Mycobacterium phage PegLeg]YP_009604879.1 neck protein [Mycobacterium phage Bongo]ALF00549.1 hypothetical protein SEA_BRICOLE_21 [Mycobacterium phage Bricole]AXQ52662.1 hypothetical protein SEA_IPHANE7_21 [Mycobacterium phage IPhane7]QDH93594.1 hypothetical protein SEA_LILHOMIEP_20 [Mycobacterium phage LilhomieP]QGJ93168.1 hypothetical protein SEA_TYDAWG_21 [Mycobacterium phage TyDawg]QUU29221.1 hypothetical protein [Mycobacterium phage SirSheldon]UXE05229.1 hypothetical pro